MCSHMDYCVHEQNWHVYDNWCLRQIAFSLDDDGDAVDDREQRRRRGKVKKISVEEEEKRDIWKAENRFQNSTAPLVSPSSSSNRGLMTAYHH